MGESFVTNQISWKIMIMEENVQCKSFSISSGLLYCNSRRSQEGYIEMTFM